MLVIDGGRPSGPVFYKQAEQALWNKPVSSTPMATASAPALGSFLVWGPVQTFFSDEQQWFSKR